MMNIVYVLTSSEGDLFFEQFWISALSVKKRMPDAHIMLLTDKATEKTFNGYRTCVYELASEIISLNLPDHLDGKARSRYLKTSTRNLVNGDFLFIDCDTIICEVLDDINEYGGELCAVWDLHRKIETHTPYTPEERKAQKTGYHVAVNGEHYNSGVIFARDTERCRAFFTLWHELWRQGYDKGITMDQPAFNEANWRMDGFIQKLAGQWNCQSIFGVQYLSSAKIIHYLGFNAEAGRTGRNHFYALADRGTMEAVHQCGKITDLVQGIIDSPKSADYFQGGVFVLEHSDDYQIIHGALMSCLRLLYRRFHVIYQILNHSLLAMRDFGKYKIKRQRL